ncbi:MAG TPA: hypothetical protein VF631_01545 [Allosphingosinicella sp.]|uniref:hypothetical protein n=1 Tax=Allosphingosinicella sp. TaxID=2823234 RepID=UPI002F29006D
MSRSERNQNARTEPFSLTVDQYGRLWLHAKLEGLEVAVDLAEKDEAFQIMATTMAEQKFEYRPISPAHDGLADNDDEMRR